MNDPKENPTVDYDEELRRIVKLMEERNRLFNQVIDSLSRIANRI